MMTRGRASSLALSQLVTQLLGDLWPGLQQRRQIGLRQLADDSGGNGFDRCHAGRSGEQPYFAEMIARAESYYDQSADLESRIERDCRPTLIAMTEIYRGLLRKVARDPQRVLRERVSLSLFSKLRIGWRAARAG